MASLERYLRSTAGSAVTPLGVVDYFDALADVGVRVVARGVELPTDALAQCSPRWRMSSLNRSERRQRRSLRFITVRHSQSAHQANLRTVIDDYP